MTALRRVDLDGLGLDEGAHLLLARALADLPAGGRVEVRGRQPALATHLPAWCRQRGHRVERPDVAQSSGVAGVVVRGSADDDRWSGAARAGSPEPAGVVEDPGDTWGLAARGALIEEGGPALDFELDERNLVWVDVAPRLYAQAAARQWDPASAVLWEAAFTLAPEIETAVVQVMTYLVENEQAALVVPARFLGKIHPHFREVVQLLAVRRWRPSSRSTTSPSPRSCCRCSGRAPSSICWRSSSATHPTP